MAKKLTKKQKRNKRRQDFLLTFFDEDSGYEEKEVNGFWLIKSFNGNKKKWQVSIYPEESYGNYKSYQKNFLK